MTPAPRTARPEPGPSSSPRRSARHEPRASDRIKARRPVHGARCTRPCRTCSPPLPNSAAGSLLFATGFMVGLMEAPCMAAVYPHLEPGEVTVGTLINMTHLAASPPGTSLAAESHAIAVEGRSVRFAVVVADAAGEIAAAGERGLRVVDAARFRDRLAAKQAQVPHPGSSPLPGADGPHNSHRTFQRWPDRPFPDDAPPVHPALNRRAIYS